MAAKRTSRFLLILIAALTSVLMLAGVAAQTAYAADDPSFTEPDNHAIKEVEKKGLFGGFCGRDSGIGPAQRAKTTIWN